MTTPAFLTVIHPIQNLDGNYVLNELFNLPNPLESQIVILLHRFTVGILWQGFQADEGQLEDLLGAIKALEGVLVKVDPQEDSADNIQALVMIPEFPLSSGT